MLSAPPPSLPEPWTHPPVPPWLTSALRGRVRNRRMPATLWMYWDTGLERAPAVVRHCVTSWVMMNAGWSLKLLTDEVVLDYLPGWTAAMWDAIQPGAHKGDIVRAAVLHLHGGVWADATHFCLIPLDAWIFEAVGDYFAFGVGDAPFKNDPRFSSGCPGCEMPGARVPPSSGCLARGGPAFDKATRRSYSISSSFLAAARGSYIAARQYECYVLHMRATLKAPEYTFFHTCFRSLAKNDSTFAARWIEVPEISSRRNFAYELSAHYSSRRPVGGGPLTATARARIDRTCATSIKTTHKGRIAPNATDFALLDNVSTVWGYLAQRTHPHVAIATRSCSQHPWPCVTTGPSLLLTTPERAAAGAYRKRHPTGRHRPGPRSRPDVRRR